MKKKINVTQLLRHLTQAAAFVFLPGLFLSTFTALRDVVAAVIAGTFSFAALAEQLVLLIIVFLLTALWGRFFCGYLCTFGAMQELVGWISKRLLPRLRAIPEKADRVLKYVKYLVLAMIVALVWIVQLPVDSSLSPWGVFGMLVSGNLTAMKAAVPTIGFGVLIAILIGSFFVERFFCRYLCPLGALFSLSSAHRLFRIRRREEFCSGCGLCSRNCAMGVSVHDKQAIKSGECIDCMRCIGVCGNEALRSAPHPAVAGTAAALVMCGLISVGNIAAADEKESTYVSVSQAESGKGRQKGKGSRKHESSTETAGESASEAPAETSSAKPEGVYADGVYTGSGSGLRGETQVRVTVEDGVITDITVLSYEDDRQYFTRAQSGVIAGILKAQSIDVSTVSGATFSSNSILEAVADALDLDFSNPNASSGMGHGRH